jgi:hypothetical protein
MIWRIDVSFKKFIIGLYPCRYLLRIKRSNILTRSKTFFSISDEL